MKWDQLGFRGAWILIALLVCAAYAGSLDAPFVYDDKVEVIGNRTIRMLESWRAIAGYNLSRPLLMFTYAWNFDRAGLDPFGYHVTNVVIHILSVGAGLAMATQVGLLGGHPRPRLVAGLAVALWAVHPMGTEAVSYTTGRSESLCAVFVYSTLAAWALALRSEREGGRGRGWRLLGLACLALAISTKEVGAMVPAAALALELIVGREGTLGARLRRTAWLWYLPVLVVMVGAAWLRLQHAGELLPKEVDRALAVQLVTSAEVWRHYLVLWIRPVGQTLFHDQAELSPASLRGVLAVLGWLMLVAGGLFWGRRVPLSGWALLSGALFLAPSTSFVPLKETMAEHRAYQLGLYLALAVGWSLGGSLARRLAYVVAVVVPLLLVATTRRNAVWSSEVALWQEAAARSPESAQAWYGLGDAHRFAKAFDPAAEAYQKSLDLDPSNLDAWNNLGIVHAEVGAADKARETWKRALERRPSYCKAHNNLGSLAYRRKQWDEAITELRSTLAYCPEDPVAHYLLGNIYYGPVRDKDKAVAHYETLIALAPHFDHADRVKKRLLEMTW